MAGILFGTPLKGSLTRESIHEEKDPTGAKYRKYKLRVHLRKAAPPGNPVCDIHIKFAKKPSVWDDVNADTSPATTGAANTPRMGNGWPNGWTGAYNATTGVLTFQAARDCNPPLGTTKCQFSFWTNGKLGKVSVNFTNSSGNPYGATGSDDGFDKNT